MINNKLGYGVVLSLIVGLSGCYMDGTRSSQNMDYYPPQSKVHANKQVEAGKQKVATKAASSEPKQVTTPGPKRAAAPQLPVIQ